MYIIRMSNTTIYVTHSKEIHLQIKYTDTLTHTHAYTHTHTHTHAHTSPKHPSRSQCDFLRQLNDTREKNALKYLRLGMIYDFPLKATSNSDIKVQLHAEFSHNTPTYNSE